MRGNFLELFLQFVKNDFKIRYKNSYLGLVWVVLKPMALFAISYFVWSNIFGTDPNFKHSLLLGLIIMMFFSELMMMGLSSLMNKAYIILKINFKRDVAVFSATFIAVIDFLINMVIFALFSINSNIHITLLGLLLFAVAMITMYLLCVAATFFISIWFIRLRDLLNIVELSIQLLYWATPIMYPLSIIPVKYQPLITYNPLTIIVTTARNGLIFNSDLSISSFYPILKLLGIAILFFVLGFIYFRKRVNKIAEYF